MINWLCPKPDLPSGGVMFIHRFANILQLNGIESRVLQEKPFDVWWDATPVPSAIYSERDIQGALKAGNTTIIPETMWHAEWKRWPNPIMFLQNWVWLDKRVPLENAKIIVCSRHLANYVQQMYQGTFTILGIVHPYVADGVFYPDPDVRIKDRVFILNRRNNLGTKLQSVLEKLRFNVMVNPGRSEQRVLADNLRRADFYTHLISPEGWPQICVEAMHSGAVVVGTTGGSGNEFMFHRETAMVAQDSTYGYQVNDDDMIYQIVAHLNFLRQNPEATETIRQRALEWSQRYNYVRSSEELLGIFKPEA